MKLPWRTASLAALAVGASVAPAARAALWLPTEGWEAQPWRLLTSHLVHHDPTHLLWDLGAFVVLGAVLEHRSPRVFQTTLAFGALAVGLAMALGLPPNGVYGGLSGIDAALFLALATGMTREGGTDRRVGLAMGAAFLAKLGWELASGGVLFAATDGVVHAVGAHAVGAVVGLVTARAGGPASCGHGGSR